RPARSRAHGAGRAGRPLALDAADAQQRRGAADDRSDAANAKDERPMMVRLARHAALAGACLAAMGAAAECGPTALGTSRTLTLPREAAAYGRAQYAALPLEPGEVVLSFDDGPRPESTPRVLQALAEQCVKATFFMNGEPMLQSPALARQVLAQGHSVGMHG